VTNDWAHICTQPNDPFTLDLKDSPWWIVGGSFIMLFGFKGPQPQIRGWFGCGLPIRVFLCYIL
jgi:hypothetical protein